MHWYFWYLVSLRLLIANTAANPLHKASILEFNSIACLPAGEL